MQRTKFSKEEITTLKANKCTFMVSESSIKFTAAFKKIFYDEYISGENPTIILEKYGFETKILGPRRPSSIAKHICEEYELYGEFHSGRKQSSLDDELKKGKIRPSIALLKMQSEIVYLKQEIEFLKKILQDRK